MTANALDSTTSPRPRVLFIGSGPVGLGGSGHLVRQAMFVDALTRTCDVTAAMFDLTQEQVAAGALKPCADVVPLATPPRPRPSRIGRYATDLLDPRPRRMLRMVGPVRRAVGALHPDDFDAVFAYRIDFAHWAGVLHHPRLLLDVDDPEYVREHRMYARAPGGADPRTARDLGKLERFERAAVRGARVAFVCQAGDAAAFDEPRPRVVPNTVDVPETWPYRPTPAADAGPSLLFVGNCEQGRRGANGDGLMWFLEEVWPGVRRRVEAEFRIVGKLSNELHALAEREGAKVLGFVPDVGEEMLRATASIAPIRFGTGTRIKILDAFAHGCPVVSTTMGADGLAANDGEHLLLGDTAEAFADQCVAALTDPALSRRVGKGGWRLARERYNRHRLVPELATQLRELIDQMAECSDI